VSTVLAITALTNGWMVMPSHGGVRQQGIGHPTRRGLSTQDLLLTYAVIIDDRRNEKRTR
jgi:hypothetical protein